MNKMDFSIFDDTKELSACLNHTKESYRPYDPGSYLYKKIWDYRFEDKFKKEFIELVYVTLSAWNMNSRQARLSSFPDFMKSILKHEDDFRKLKNLDITKLYGHKDVFEKLFKGLELVKTKSPLVTFSKTLHFFLPNLIAPIDRKYTIRFFYGNNNDKVFKTPERQFEVFWKIETIFSEFAQRKNLNKYLDNHWNRSIPKILDNAVIGKISKILESEQD